MSLVLTLCLVVLAVHAECAMKAYDDNVLNALFPGCTYGGARHEHGAEVSTRDACMRCRCARGSLTCQRITCVDAVIPEGCHTRLRKNRCCVELHCPESVRTLENKASARIEHDTPSTSRGCIESGVEYSAGSAMASAVPCEECFCLGGSRRCVRPQCMRAPPGCVGAPAAGACCPARYHCNRDTDVIPHTAERDCRVENAWVKEGERVMRPDVGECVRCFCLRGVVHCQALACAPALPGCRPLLAPGDCCPRRYSCSHRENGILSAVPAKRGVKRSFRTSVDMDTTTVRVSPLATIQVKRKTNAQNSTANEAIADVGTASEGVVRIVINGTTNCTTQLSSAPYEPSRPRVSAAAAHRVDVITDKTIEFADDDVFTVNVTSSLRANTTHAMPGSVVSVSRPDRDEYDYEYAEATLPPSLPNLKIIPFVAADAVSGEKRAAVSTYPSLERNDKFPVYFHNVGNSAFASRREDAPDTTDAATTEPFAKLDSPTVNMFSPPVKTEGGFVPKSSAIVDDYYIAYGSTLPRLTTSMLLDATEEDNGTQSTSTSTTVSPPASTFANKWEDAATTTDHILNKTSTTRQHVTATGAIQEYEEDDEDDSFSFGNVLKLLLSDSYDTSEATTKPTETTSKNVASGNKIDHLVLGQSQSINKPSLVTGQPLATTTSLLTTTRSPLTSTRSPLPSTRSQLTFTRSPATTGRPQPINNGMLPTTNRPLLTTHKPPEASVMSSSVLKLAGCNIYGQMHAVGAIIPELSSTCDHCRCTHLGVHCTRDGGLRRADCA